MKDGKGENREYADSVSQWIVFHNQFPNYNSNMITADLRVIMFHLNLFGRAKDLCKSIPTATLQSAAGVTYIVKALQKIDPILILLWCTMTLIL